MAKGKFLLFGLIGFSGLFAASACEELTSLSLANTTITMAVSVPAGPFVAPDGTTFPSLPAFCRVAGSIRPSSDSDIQFEVWMPNSDWNGRFAGADNGGFGGSINYAKMGDALSHNYAAASTDTGHRAGSLGALDASWAMGHPEKVIDFGYRAIHETAQKAQAIVTAFSGQGPSRSYFDGCSNGGRQALMEAQRFPADYDGIIAGSPASNWTHLFSSSVWANQVLALHYLPPSKLPAIEAAALAACDGLDGVVDGVIDDPRKCRFDPSTLLCQSTETDACLTAPQIATLQKLYAGPVNSAGTQVFPGYPVGGQTGSNGWPLWVTGATQGTGAMFYFGYFYFTDMVYGDPNWNPLAFDIDSDVAAADLASAATLNATDPDLTAFQKRGGKLILFHGWSDPAIAAASTIDYYQSVIARLGPVGRQSFIRLFLAPGMQHCEYGPGPDSFGQNGFDRGDPQHDLEAALELWVERGVAPQRIVATRYNTDLDPSSGVLRTRPLCAYPAVARWMGYGDTNDAANFTCVDTTSNPRRPVPLRPPM
ncbi:MAG: tannase/feruloyl esterase family alpha/beta hydrolase [Bryobacteraceae bacterium]|jgi:feruloyl esterase